MLQTPRPDLPHYSKATPHSRPGNKVNRMHHNDHSKPHQDDGFAGLSAGELF